MILRFAANLICKVSVRVVLEASEVGAGVGPIALQSYFWTQSTAAGELDV